MTTPKPVIGACVVPCSRCGQPMRVEVTAELSPIQRPGMHELKIRRGDEQLGVCWWQIKPVGSDHRCPRRSPQPLRRAS